MPVLNVEHVACNVSDPVAMAAWYVEHLGMRVVRRIPTPPYIHFLADANGRAVIEIYTNPTADPVPDYAAMHPMRFHLAFAAPILTRPGPRSSPPGRRLSTSRRSPTVHGC